MSSPEITDKMLDAISIGLNPKCTVHIHEGTVRSSKTTVAIIEFFEAVQKSDEVLHLIAAADLDAIRENILKVKYGLMDQFSEWCSLRKDYIGGYYVVVRCDYPGKPAQKKILLANYSDASKWEKILGKTFGVIFIDEVNTADEQFVDECFARQVSCDEPLQIWTLNGDTPDLWVYTKYINHARIYGNAPMSIRKDMDRTPKVNGWWYQHWTMEDNPIMTPEKIERAKSIYPVGSYYYTIKILGERGSAGEKIYQSYMDDTLIKPLKTEQYMYFGLGVDIGATRACNSFTLIGITADYSKVGVIDKITFEQCGYKEKTQRLKEFVYKWRDRYVVPDYIAVDSAEQNYIADLKMDFKRENLPPVIPSYKATIKQRIDMNVVLLAKQRIEFNDTEEGREVYRAFQSAKWEDGKTGQVREDKNERINDILDSLEYAETRHMKKILAASGVEIE